MGAILALGKRQASCSRVGKSKSSAFDKFVVEIYGQQETRLVYYDYYMEILRAWDGFLGYAGSLDHDMQTSLTVRDVGATAVHLELT